MPGNSEKTYGLIKCTNVRWKNYKILIKKNFFESLEHKLFIYSSYYLRIYQIFPIDNFSPTVKPQLVSYELK